MVGPNLLRLPTPGEVCVSDVLHFGADLLGESAEARPPPHFSKSASYQVRDRLKEGGARVGRPRTGAPGLVSTSLPPTDANLLI
jgi:hypothetical protein